MGNMFKTIIYFIFFVIESMICGPYLLTDMSTRIVGGVEVDIRDYPFMASTQVLHFHFCGATVLTPIWLLSAAHCGVQSYNEAGDMIKYEVDYLTVVVGSTTINERESGAQVRRVAEFIMHPGFVHDSFTNDIALIRVIKPFHLDSNRVARVPLTTTDNTEVNPIPDGECIALGWGLTDPEPSPLDAPNVNVTVKPKAGAGRPSPVLRMVQLKLIPIAECKKILRLAPILDKQNICTSTKGEKDGCKGDSGGPLICNGQQWAVTSWGEGCAQKGIPGAWTRIDGYLPWIKMVTGRTIPPTRSDSTSGSSGLKHNVRFGDLQYLFVFLAYLLDGMLYGNLIKYP